MADCPTHKVPYLRAQYARRAASRLRRRGGPWIGMHAYRCPECGLWHTGHRAGTKRVPA